MSRFVKALATLGAAALLTLGFTPGALAGTGPVPDVGRPAVAAAAAVTAAAAKGYCDPSDTGSVTVVVDFSGVGGGIDIRCSSGATGQQALANAFSYSEIASQPGFVCQIEGAPASDCQDTPPGSAYWSYWQAAPGGGWSYSTPRIQLQPGEAGRIRGLGLRVRRGARHRSGAARRSRTRTAGARTGTAGTGAGTPGRTGARTTGRRAAGYGATCGTTCAGCRNPRRRRPHFRIGRRRGSGRRGRRAAAAAAAAQAEAAAAQASASQAAVAAAAEAAAQAAAAQAAAGAASSSSAASSAVSNSATTSAGGSADLSANESTSGSTIWFSVVALLAVASLGTAAVVMSRRRRSAADDDQAG